MKLKEKVGFIFGIIGIFVLSVAAVTVIHSQGNAQALKTPARLSSITPAPVQSWQIPSQSGRESVVYVHSSDGLKQVIMHRKIQADNSVLYTFSTADVPSAGETVFFTRAIGGGGAMKVPLNTYSPDDKYLYLEEDEAGFTDIYVFKADGSLFNNGQQYLNVSSLFAQRQTNYIFHTATGWDSYALMHILTSTDGKNPGPKFWFDLSNMSFIQLAS